MKGKFIVLYLSFAKLELNDVLHIPRVSREYEILETPFYEDKLENYFI